MAALNALWISFLDLFICFPKETRFCNAILLPPPKYTTGERTLAPNASKSIDAFDV